jgi:hypothetical protein
LSHASLPAGPLLVDEVGCIVVLAVPDVQDGGRGLENVQRGVLRRLPLVHDERLDVLASRGKASRRPEPRNGAQTE